MNENPDASKDRQMSMQLDCTTQVELMKTTSTQKYLKFFDIYYQGLNNGNPKSSSHNAYSFGK